MTTLDIKIENLTEAQAIAIEDMFQTWVSLGSAGFSRWTCFFADGDGNFRPKITVNGNPPVATTLLRDDQKWQGDEYRIDLDTIAWLLRKDHKPENRRLPNGKKY